MQTTLTIRTTGSGLYEFTAEAAEFVRAQRNAGTPRQLDQLHAGPPLGFTSAVAINNRGQVLVNGSAQQTWILTPLH